MNVYYYPAFIVMFAALLILIQLCFKRSHVLSYITSGLSLLAALIMQIYLQTHSNNLINNQTISSDVLFVFNAETSFVSLLLLMVVIIIWAQLYHWLKTINEQNEQNEEYYLLFY